KKHWMLLFSVLYIASIIGAIYIHNKLFTNQGLYRTFDKSKRNKLQNGLYVLLGFITIFTLCKSYEHISYYRKEINLSPESPEQNKYYIFIALFVLFIISGLAYTNYLVRIRKMQPGDRIKKDWTWIENIAFYYFIFFI